MNALKTIAVFAMLVLTAASSALAAVNNVNSRGQFVPMGTNLNAGRSYSRPAYRGNASGGYAYRAPAAPVASAPMVASAPTEARRFSYNPAAPAAPAVTSGSSCNGATTTVPATSSARRFSYDPSAETTVAPAPATAPRVYSTQPSSSGRSRGSSNLQPWQRLKTDPLKYNN